jgi:uncharacterized OsmC-like protein
MPEQSVAIRQDANYRFAIRFAADLPVLQADEPAPLGEGAGPSPVQLLAAAVGNCLSASLVFALRKFKQSAEPVSAQVEATVERNEKNRLRVQKLHVRLTLGVPAATLAHLDKVLAQFEEFCTVTQSIRAAVPVDLEVRDSDGKLVAGAGAPLATAQS